MEVDAMNTTSNRYCRNIRIINTGDLSIQSWRITFQTSNTITPWGATSSRSNNTFTLSPYRDTAALLAGEIRDIGFCSNGTDRDSNWKLETSLDTRYLGSSSNYYNQSYSPTTYNTTNSYSNTSTQYCYNSSTRSYEACGVSSVYTAPTCYNNVTGRYETCSNATNTTYSSNPYCYNSVARVYEACNSMNNNTLYYYNSNTNSYEPYYNTNYSSQSNYTPLSDNSYSCYNSITRTYERCYYNSNTSYYPNYSNTNAGLPSPTTHTYIPTNGGTSSTNYYQNPNYGTYYPDSYNTNTVAV